MAVLWLGNDGHSHTTQKEILENNPCSAPNPAFFSSFFAISYTDKSLSVQPPNIDTQRGSCYVDLVFQIQI